MAMNQKVEGAEEEGDGAPEGTEVDFALIFYNLAVGWRPWAAYSDECSYVCNEPQP